MPRANATDQPNLFDPEDPDTAPVPFELTARGRRLVDPTTPELRLVRQSGDPAIDAPAAGPDRGRDGRGHVADLASGGAAEPAAQGAIDDARIDDELRNIDGPVHARVRALRRAGTATEVIRMRVDLDPLTLAVFRATDPDVASSPTSTTRSASRPQGRSVAPDLHHDRPRGDADSASARSPLRNERASTAAAQAHMRAVRALACIATVGEVDAAGLGLTTNRIAVAATVVSWLRRDRGIRPAAMRVVLRVADVATADLVASAWADRLGVGRDRVATVAWRSAPGPRDVQAVVRVTDPELAAELTTALARWPDQ